MAKKSAGQSAGASGEAFTSTGRVKELIALMTENGLSEIELVDGARRIALRRGVPASAAGGGGAVPMVSQFAAPMPQQQAPAAPAAPKAEDESLIPIKSPMVGTFYSAPSPDAPAFISVGSAVDEKTVVCIIEAMKHFNEIHAEVRGTVTKVLISNGQVVEFGQPLFMVKPG